MPVPSQGHYGFHSIPVVDWFCLFIYLWVLTFPLEDCSEFGNFVITLINVHSIPCFFSDFFLSADLDRLCKLGIFWWHRSQLNLLVVPNYTKLCWDRRWVVPV
jgi:hypothetical protein